MTERDDDLPFAQTERHTGERSGERRVYDPDLRDLRERMSRIEARLEKHDTRLEKHSGALYGSEEGLGLQHEITALRNESKNLTGKVDQLLANRIPRWLSISMTLIALALGALVAWASLGGANG